MSAHPVYLDAELFPSRSLSINGYHVVLMLVAASSAVMATVFLSMGYTPIAISLAVAVAGFWFLLARGYQDQRQRTFIRVTSQSIDLRHVDGRGRETSASLPSYFARVELDRSGPHPGRAIRIASAGKAYLIGKYLTAEERADVIQSLRSALQNARAERHASD